MNVCEPTLGTRLKTTIWFSARRVLFNESAFNVLICWNIKDCDQTECKSMRCDNRHCCLKILLISQQIVSLSHLHIEDYAERCHFSSAQQLLCWYRRKMKCESDLFGRSFFKATLCGLNLQSVSPGQCSCSICKGSRAQRYCLKGRTCYCHCWALWIKWKWIFLLIFEL